MVTGDAARAEELLGELARAYAALARRHVPPRDDAARLAIVVDVLRWYAERLGTERAGVPARPGRWSFVQVLEHLAGQAVEEAGSSSPLPIRYFIDHGKEHVGQAAEMLFLFDGV